ncbi:MAG: hypothetical protein ABWY05_08570 [Noviherbaspirillum sp.]
MAWASVDGPCAPVAGRAGAIRPAPLAGRACSSAGCEALRRSGPAGAGCMPPLPPGPGGGAWVVAVDADCIWGCSSVRELRRR